mmetsp:Transcript_15584/g.32000  ORF Transcript_15584/g.32000 Transcript_15584/m.32000 type:complete len:246 (-) Transcript_15584:364-1101(-)
MRVRRQRTPQLAPIGVGGHVVGQGGSVHVQTSVVGPAVHHKPAAQGRVPFDCRARKRGGASKRGHVHVLRAAAASSVRGRQQPRRHLQVPSLARVEEHGAASFHFSAPRVLLAPDGAEPLRHAQVPLPARHAERSAAVMVGSAHGADRPSIVVQPVAHLQVAREASSKHGGLAVVVARRGVQGTSPSVVGNPVQPLANLKVPPPARHPQQGASKRIPNAERGQRPRLFEEPAHDAETPCAACKEN